MTEDRKYTEVCRKIFYPLDRHKPTIGGLMMVKNEEKRITVTINSLIGHVDALIVYDTGSTDRTMEIIQNIAEKNRINLYMIQGTFVDFSTSRNVSLDYADTIDVHYLILLDCNDELRGGPALRQLAKDFLTQKNTGFLVCQQWWSGQLSKYYNMRLVKARTGWRYRGSVHEWLKDTTVEGPAPAFPIIRLPDTVVLYQDRLQDDDKSLKRFSRDRELLLSDYRKNPTDPRTLFYLAQTCDCLNNYEEALYYSKLRLEQTGFDEEVFHSYMRCGNASMALKHSWHDCMSWYIKAFEHSYRAEPLIKIADYYRSKEKWPLAYMFANQACMCEYPEGCILFVDNGIYQYYRWHVMAMIAGHVGKYEQGKQAAEKALQTAEYRQLNEPILNFYLDIEKKAAIKNASTEKDVFIATTMAKLREQFPQSEESVLMKRAVAMWKKRKEKDEKKVKA